MTVLVGFLPTPEGEAAFAAGLAEARRRGEDLLVLNSPRGGAPVSADVAPPELVAQLTERSRTDGVALEVRQTPHTGDLADSVLRVAEEADASLIVIGLRRRSPVGKLLMGSSAQRILLDADRPVLAVKPHPSAG
ncbi:universal stress protein [Modestobacter marinus]|uniref:Nucleotide-binding universal stress UspA family protein n=1 Tax=Modestobacter marinus TaxID=477641 RepID=A0A846LT65_9ACTN|nr:universal stress protein [Modestobacter marinus]NIH68815.1 nucleotide-binding universal stress UspA family protein [Modestobacter marinus]GGL60252.1 universal stress protein [Modestobacter marinus]